MKYTSNLLLTTSISPCIYNEINLKKKNITFGLLLQLLPHTGAGDHTVALDQAKCEPGRFSSLVIASFFLGTPWSLRLGRLPFTVHSQKTTLDRRRRPLVATAVCRVILPDLLALDQAQFLAWNVEKNTVKERKYHARISRVSY